MVRVVDGVLSGNCVVLSKTVLLVRRTKTITRGLRRRIVVKRIRFWSTNKAIN